MPASPSSAAAIDLSVTRGCLCLTARRHARAITRLFDEHLRAYGLRSTQFSVLAALSLMGPTRIGDLADALGTERTTLTRSVALLERNGWTRTEGSGDGRARVIAVTAAGRRKVERALPAWQRAQAVAEQGESTTSPR
jgi:DNA-binding MarR family transcriptional regulator